MIRVAFRFDDPSPVSKRHVEDQVFQQFFSRQLPITCGIIPTRIRGDREIRLSSKNAGLLRDAASSGLLDVAQHGFHHMNRGKAPSGNKSEFEGLSLSEQRHLVESGRGLLEDVLQSPVSGFIPPWNSFDANTLKVLEAQEIPYISADMAPPPHFPEKLRVLPATCVLGQLEKNLARAQAFKRQEPVIVVVMHHYDFDPDPDDPPYEVFDYERLGRILDKLSEASDVVVESLNELAGVLTARAAGFWGKQVALREILPERYRYKMNLGFMLTKLI